MTGEGRQIQTTSLHVRAVACLFALAAAAELAAHAPGPARRATIYVLLRCEAIAYSLVYWAYRDCGSSLGWALPGEVRYATCPAAALALADWFRVLAVALRDLPRRMLIEKHRCSTFPFPGSSRAEAAGERQSRPGSCDRLGSPDRPVAPDTS